MIKKFNLLILTLLIIFTNTNKVYADHPWTYGNAAKFEIIVRKLEICTGFQGGHSFNIREKAFCNEAVVLGETPEGVTMDIASVEVGEAIDTYGNPSELLSFGTTYTHVRLTIDKKFVVKNKQTKDSNGDLVGLNTGSAATSNCNTRKLTDDMYGKSLSDTDYQSRNNHLWTETRYKYSTEVSWGEDAAGTLAEEMNMYMINGTDFFPGWDNVGDQYYDHYFCYGPLCRSWGYWAKDYDTDGLERADGLSRNAVAMSIPRRADLPEGETPSTQHNSYNGADSFDSTDDLIFVFELESPHTVGRPAQLDIAFNTNDALMVFEATNGEETGQCPDGEGTCGTEGQGAMCAFRLGKVSVLIKMEVSAGDAGGWQ